MYARLETQLLRQQSLLKRVAESEDMSSILDMIHYAARLSDLKAPPGNRLEALSRDLEGYHSIRVNDQWRIVFRWAEAGPSEVRIIDYH